MNCHQVSGHALWQWWQDTRRQASLHQAAQQSNLSEQPDAFRNSNLLAELDWLLREVAGLDRLSLLLGFREHELVHSRLTLPELQQVWQRRVTEHIPLQYLLGVAPWRDLDLIVSPAVLIPRPETEDLIDLAVTAAHQAPYPPPNQQEAWADLGTGSGAIAIGLAQAFPTASIYAVDYSAAALAIARQNIQRLELAARIHCYQGSWLEPLAFLQGQLRGIVANPPYIPTAMIRELQPEVANHEPHLALDGGPDGLSCLHVIIATAPVYLQPGGILLLEMMAGQAQAIQELIHQQGCYTQVQIFADLAGLERFALAYRQPL